MLELSGDPRHRGKLDPLAIGLAELREELASSYLLELLRDPPPAWENAIDRAVRDAVRAGERSLAPRRRAAARAAKPRPAHEAAEALEVLSDFGLARLGFADGEARRTSSSCRRSVITIRTPGLSLPDPGASRETYTRAERVSVATLSLVAAQALRLVSTQPTPDTRSCCWTRRGFCWPQRRAALLLNRLVRLGRAMNATILLATQRLADLGDLSDLVGTYFLFGQDSTPEAERALAHDRPRPRRPALRSRLTEYRQGRCLMRDLDGRVGEVQVDLVFDALLAALDTTPRAATA